MKICFPKIFRHLITGFCLLAGLVVFFGNAHTAIGNPDDYSSISMDSVSVENESGHVRVSWTLELAADTLEGEIRISRQRAEGSEEFDHFVTLDDIEQNTFLDTQITANNKQVGYFVTADINGPMQDPSTLAHYTVFTEGTSTDVCLQSIRLFFDGYRVTTSVGAPVNQPIPFDSYKILYRHNGGEEQEYASGGLPGDFSEFLLEDLEPGQYCFRIQYLDSGSGITSTSNTKCVELTTLTPPAFSTIRAADIVDNALVQIRLHEDESVVNPSYVIHRAFEAGIDYQPLDTLMDYHGGFIVYDDQDTDFQQGQWYYQTEVLDSCGFSAFFSAPSSTLFLSALPDGPFQNRLNWAFDPSWPKGIAEYELYRKLPGMPDFQYLQTFNAATNDYMDDISALDAGQLGGDIAYKLKASENQGSNGEESETVWSNHVLIRREAEVFVPNAFRPSSDTPGNRVFKPVLRFALEEGYRLVVFSRWGQEVFSSSNPDIGWDGSHNGNEAPAGVYAWVLKYRTGQGKAIEKKGVVKLVR